MLSRDIKVQEMLSRASTMLNNVFNQIYTHALIYYLK